MPKQRKRQGALELSPVISMAPSLSSLFLSHQTRPYPPLISPAPATSRRLGQHLRPQTLAFCAPKRSSSSSSASSSSTKNQSPIQEDPSSTPKPPYPSERKSFAVATGELFLGLASRLIKSRISKRSPSGDDSLLILDGGNVKGGRNYSKERIGAVLEDEIEPEVIWEQRVKDVEAEKKRRVVTSPGFSFSAAGLLFPYHLGVAQFLIEKGYIKVRNSFSRFCIFCLVSHVDVRFICTFSF